MATTKLDRIAELDLEIAQIKNRQRELRLQHNRQVQKERTHRLCRRGGLVEKLLPDLAAITDEQFEIFVKKTLLSGYAEKFLKELAPDALDAGGDADNIGNAQYGDIDIAEPAEAALDVVGDGEAKAVKPLRAAG
jgi:hypothetical protein